jgi:general secretion pathway protein G
MNKKYQIRHPQNGLTLVEMMVAIAILGIVSSIGVSLYKDYTVGANVNRAVTEIRMIDLLIKDYRLTTRRYPPNLAAIGVDYQDPWGNDYQYLDITAENGVGNLRKDHNLVPINTDFDLYSMGPDGSSVPPLTAVSSHDDIIRANNGRYVGVADGY